MLKNFRGSETLGQILLGFLALQVCVFTINGAPQRASTLSFNQLINVLGNRSLEVGSTLPRLSVAGTDGRAGGLPGGAGESVLVFRGSCNCQDVAVWDMVRAAQRAHQPVALINVVARDGSANFHAPTLSLDQMFSYRSTDYAPVAPRGADLPYAVHVRAGVIVGVGNS